MINKLTSTIKIGILLVIFVWAIILVYLWMDGPGYRKGCILPGCQETLIINNKGDIPSNLSKVQPPRNRTVHVCIAANENTLGGMVATINSIHSNTKRPVMYHLVTNQQSLQHLRDWIKKTSLKDIHFEIKVFPEEWVKDKISVKDSRADLSNPITFARFYITKLFPSLKGKVVYIDDDSVIQGDIHRLVSSVHLREGKIAAVADDCSASSKRFTILNNFYMHFINFDHKGIANMGMKRMQCSFNTGVFVFDADRWRVQNITENLDKWMSLNKKENVFGNQKAGGASAPPMMIVLYNMTAPLDPTWNMRFLGTPTALKRYSRQFLKSANLLHWSGPDKPWMSRSPYVEFWEKWYIPDPTKKFHLTRKSSVV